MTYRRNALIAVPNVEDLLITEGLTLPAAELKWRAVRSSGPGGQNVNKVSTKVELRFDLAHSEVLSDAVKARLSRLAASYLDAGGCLVITSQSARSQRRNLEQALELLAGLVQRALVVPRKRKKTRPTAGSHHRRLQTKRLNSDKKQARRRVSEE